MSKMSTEINGVMEPVFNESHPSYTSAKNVF